MKDTLSSSQRQKNIFISYRREDSSGYAIALYKELVTRLGSDYNVFMDVDSIDAGANFVEVVEKALVDCDAVLVLIGPKWLELFVTRSNETPTKPDYARIEVSTALQHRVRIIPVLIDNTVMPSAEELPEDIKALANLNALEIRNTRFDADLDQVVVTLQGTATGSMGMRRRRASSIALVAKGISNQARVLWQMHPYRVIIITLLLAISLIYVKTIVAIVPLVTYIYDAWDVSRPIGDHETTRLNNIDARISTRLSAAINGLRLEGASVDPWTYSDALVGLEMEEMPEASRAVHYDFLLSQKKQDQHCWVQGEPIPGVKDPCHLATTAWVLFAFAHMQKQAPIESWLFVLEEQNNEGWWPLYQGAKQSNENASIYATALITLAMQLHIDRSLIASSELAKIREAMALSSNWLAQHRIQAKCAWPDYPNHKEQRHDINALTGLVAYVLSQVKHPDHAALCNQCVNRLTAERPSLEVTTNNSLIEFRLADGSIISDRVNHMELVWSGIGVESCYALVDWGQRIQSRYFITQSLFANNDRPDDRLTQTWMLGETKLLLRSLSGKPIL